MVFPPSLLPLSYCTYPFCCNEVMLLAARLQLRHQKAEGMTLAYSAMCKKKRGQSILPSCTLKGGRCPVNDNSSQLLLLLPVCSNLNRPILTLLCICLLYQSLGIRERKREIEKSRMQMRKNEKQWRAVQCARCEVK